MDGAEQMIHVAPVHLTLVPVLGTFRHLGISACPDRFRHDRDGVFGKLIRQAGEVASAMIVQNDRSTSIGLRNYNARVICNWLLRKLLRDGRVVDGGGDSVGENTLTSIGGRGNIQDLSRWEQRKLFWLDDVDGGSSGIKENSRSTAAEAGRFDIGGTIVEPWGRKGIDERSSDGRSKNKKGARNHDGL